MVGLAAAGEVARDSGWERVSMGDGERGWLRRDRAATDTSADLVSQTRSAKAAMARTSGKSCVETWLRTSAGSRSSQAVWKRIPGGSPRGSSANILDMRTDGRVSPRCGWCRIRLAMTHREGA